MATLTSTHARWAKSETQANNFTLRGKWLAFAAGQEDRKTFWFLFSLIFQGVFFLPLPAVLTFYFNAPLFVLGITLTLFFANIIAGMGGSGIRTLLNLFAVSVLAHLIMLATYVL